MTAAMLRLRPGRLPPSCQAAKPARRREADNPCRCPDRQPGIGPRRLTPCRCSPKGCRSRAPAAAAGPNDDQARAAGRTLDTRSADLGLEIAEFEGAIARAELRLLLP